MKPSPSIVIPAFNEAAGVWRMILLMWQLRWHYWHGEAAARLAETCR